MVDFGLFGVEAGGVVDFLVQFFINPLMWFLIAVFVLGSLLFILYIRKRRRLIFPTIEIVDLGNGKTGLNNLKSGWFGRKTYLRGLIDRGERVLKTNYGDEILDFSTEDYQEVNGKRGVICYRDPLNQKILVPINNLKHIKNKDLLAEIPPSSYIDTVIDLVKDSEKETRDTNLVIAQYVIFGLVIIFALIGLIVIANMVKQGQTESKDLILNAGGICTESAKEAFRTAYETLSVQASNAP